MTEDIHLNMLHRDGSISSIEVQISTEPVCSIKVMSIQHGNGLYEASDLFAALAELRVFFEKQGLLVLCNGARPDVFPSGMTREMSRGRKAYILKMGRHPDRSDIVDIFESVPAAVVDTVKAQLEYFEVWKKSLDS